VTFALYLDAPRDSDDVGPLLSSPRSAGLHVESAEQPALHAEWALVQRLRTGDPAALETLVAQYFAPLAQFANHFTHSADAAEDIAQSVLTKVWERREQWMPRMGVRAYLFAAVRNAALNLRKHDAVIARHHASILAEQPASVDPEGADTAAELRRQFRSAFAELTERQRTTLRLRYEQRLSTREIGAILGITPRAVERLLARAVIVLRDAMRS
jgi:RNA polymerase sigma factor (sigma-70 family)